VTKHNVVIGPYRLAKRFARRRGWNLQDVIVVSTAAALHVIDPPTINKIVVLGRRLTRSLFEEIESLRALWHIRITRVPVPL